MRAKKHFVKIDCLAAKLGKKVPVDVAAVVTAVGPLGSVKRQADGTEFVRRYGAPPPPPPPCLFTYSSVHVDIRVCVLLEDQSRACSVQPQRPCVRRGGAATRDASSLQGPDAGRRDAQDGDGDALA